MNFGLSFCFKGLMVVILTNKGFDLKIKCYMLKIIRKVCTANIVVYHINRTVFQ